MPYSIRLIVSFLFLCCTLSASGQTARISGKVTDPTGAIVPGARVSAVQGGSGTAETSSDSQGNYVLDLPPGQWQVTASARRFQGQTKEVNLGATPFQVDFALTIPAVEQTITVEEDVARISLEQVPGNTALVDQGDITRSMAVTLKDVLAFTPGVLVQPRFGADESQFSIRGSGLRSNFHERGVNLFINGEPYQDADGFSDFEALELRSVREVEVWKGANALRYGGNTSGGAVNFITYTGENASPFLVSVEGGSYGLFKGQVSSGGVHGPISYYTSVSDTEIDGYRQFSQQGRQRFYGNLGWRLSQDTKARFDLIYVNAAEQLPGSLTRAEFLADPRQADANNVLNRWGRYQNAVHLGVDVTHRINDRQELEVIAYGRYRDLWHPIFEVLDQETRSFGGEVRYRYIGNIFGRGIRFVFGFAPQTGTQGDRNWVNVLGSPGNLTKHYGARATNWGIYFENQFDLTRSLTLTFGGRGDLAQRDYNDLLNNGESDQRRYDSFSPKIGLTWRAGEQVQFFANASRSYEPPLLFELTSSDPANTQGFLPLRPQDTWQYEAGTRGVIAQRVNWDIAFFNLEVNNELLNFNYAPFPNAPFTIPSYRNSLHTRHRGVELGLGAMLKSHWLREGDQLSFRSAYTFADYTFVRDSSFTGNQLPGQPRHLLRSELRYQHPSGAWIAPILDWSPASYFADSANTAANDQYAVLNLKAGYERRRWSFYLEAANLFDRNYSASVQVDSGDLRFYEPANGRSLYGGVKWHF
jgi:iron complex outermembrane recepter protein